jgi:hypothetical protein
MNGRNLEEIDFGIIEVLSQHLPEGTEKTTKKSPSGWPMFRPRFELITSQGVTAAST